MLSLNFILFIFSFFFLFAAPHDHLLASNRSHAYASIYKFKQALADADLVISLRPDWPKVNYILTMWL